MLRHWSYRACTRLLLLALLSSLLPGAPRVAQGTPALAAPAEPTAPSTPQITAPVVARPRLPSLTLHLSVAPDPIAVGQTAAVTLTVTNQADNPAESLVVTLPTPDGALALPGPHTISPTQGWQWTVGHLGGDSQTTLTAALRLVRQPRGDALLLRAQASARDLQQPLYKSGGALAIDRTQAPATVRFTPGTPAELRSPDGRIAVQIPPRAATRALTLRSTQAGANPGREIVAFKRGLGTFSLDAADDQGVAVRQFSAPLTITVYYTPEQLQARAIAESDLTLFWFDETERTWVPLETSVDLTAGAASASVDHFTDFALGDGSSPSEAFLPSLQGFQVSSFTGAASYSYPIDVPAGPASSPA